MYFNDDTYIAELLWYFNYSEADLGVSSNWNAMVNAAILPSTGEWKDSISDSLLNKISKRREVEKAYYRLLPQHKKCLYACYGEQSPPFAIEKVFQKLAPFALCSEMATPAELISICDKLIRGKCNDKEKSTISRVRMDATKLNRDSLEAYKTARKHNEK